MRYNEPEYSKFDLERMRGREDSPYIADDGLIAAANVALALGRPLLLTGEPGCGKTDFAFAAARGLWRGDPNAEEAWPLQYYVRSDTTAKDLLYRYDTMRRFSDAQTGNAAARRQAQLAKNYITLEALGEALVSPVRRVVLIDEIDKAQRDLPNDLLRELDQAQFEIAEIVASEQNEEDVLPGHLHIQRNMAAPPEAPRPLVVITSNVERQLPDAFLRRCIFYYVPFPEALLEGILDSRFEKPADESHRESASLFLELRKQSLTKRPATAELIDWVGVLRTVFAPEPAWAKVSAAAADLRAGRPVNWLELDGISALVKLREDFAALKALQASRPVS